MANATSSLHESIIDSEKMCRPTSISFEAKKCPRRLLRGCRLFTDPDAGHPPPASSIFTAANFMFSTENFTQCFSSAAGDFLNRQLYTSTDQMSGEFDYSGRLSPPQQLVRCDIGIRVHEDSDIQFNITNAHLPCEFGRFMIYESTNLEHEKRRVLYCDEKLDLRRNISIQSHRAVVTFIMKRFSPRHHLACPFFCSVTHCGAVPKQQTHQRQCQRPRNPQGKADPGSLFTGVNL